ncbi:MAG: hypothetical protein L6V91_00670 [Bacilli bacterium]|nr:MAG: hypothetical protein L6V91_00670 [Bacilli bacterium]
MEKNYNSYNKYYKRKNYLLTFTFITINIINGILLRINTVNNGLRFSPIVMELGFLLLISLVSLKIKKNKKIYYYESITILLTIICIVNSIYYHYYNSFSSLSILANITFASDVKSAIVEKCFKKMVDLIYIWAPMALIIVYKRLNKKIFSKKELKSKKIVS